MDSCNSDKSKLDSYTEDQTEDNSSKNLLKKYTKFTLTIDLSKLSENQKKMIPILMEASEIMDELFWYDAYGGKEKLIESVKNPARS